MVRSWRENETIRVEVRWKRSPLIYFDQFALHHFASNKSDRERFFKVFETGGELLFSVVNMVEVNSLQGDSADRVRSFLRDIGLHWLPVRFDAEQVARELVDWRRGSGVGHPTLDTDLIREIHRAAGQQLEGLNLATAVDIYRSDLAEHAKVIARSKARMVQAMATARKRMRDDPSHIDRKFPLPERVAVREIHTRLMRLLLQELPSYQWLANDAFDLLHAIVPLYVAQVIFLDKQWKRRVMTLPNHLLPNRVFYGQEFDAFLDYFESAHSSVPIP